MGRFLKRIRISINFFVIFHNAEDNYLNPRNRKLPCGSEGKLFLYPNSFGDMLFVLRFIAVSKTKFADLLILLGFFIKSSCPEHIA